MNCLVNIATYGRSLVLVDNEIVACALRVIQEQGTGTASFNPTPPHYHPARYRTLQRVILSLTHIRFPSFASFSMQI